MCRFGIMGETDFTDWGKKKDEYERSGRGSLKSLTRGLGNRGKDLIYGQKCLHKTLTVDG